MARGHPDQQYGSAFDGRDSVDESSDASGYGTYFLGRYRVVDEIGVGGMASVHLARMDGAGGFQKWVAIKKIHPHLIEDDQFIQMFLDEARIAARISHPNVAQVFDLGEHENTYWIAMEYLHGEPLREVMRFNDERGTFTRPELAARIIADAADGLHAAHELKGKNGESLNLVHRDVSPHNLFLTYEGMVKVVDFGIAKVSGRLSNTRAGTLKGKLAYMSPEQVRGAAIDRRTDIFALGVVAWEMITGRRLFRMDSDLETLEKVQACVVPPPSTVRPDVPAELESIVMRALQKRLDVRFQTARELSRALQQFLMRCGQFVGPEEVSAYVAGIFGDRIQQRAAHLRWAAEVTQTISLDQLKNVDAPSESGSYDEISMVSYDGQSRSDPLADTSRSALTIQGGRRAGAQGNGYLPAPQPVPQRQAPAPVLPPAHGIHMPAPRMPAELAAPARSVVITATPPASNHRPYDDEEEEEIATIVAPSRLFLEREQSAPVPAAGMPPPAHQPSRSAPTVPPPRGGPPSHPQMAAPPAFQQQQQPYFGQPQQPPPQYSPAGVAPQGGYGMPQGAMPPPQTDFSQQASATQQLPVVRANHTVVYVAAALGTFFVVVGIAAIVLLRAQAQDVAPTAASATAPATSAAPSQPAAVASAQPSEPSVDTNALPKEPATAQPTATAAAPPKTVATAKPPAPRTASPATAAPPPPATEKVDPGFLTVVCNPFCDSVTAGGRNLGPSPVVKAPMPPGQYRVVLKRSGGSTKVIPAIVVSGQVTSHRVPMD